MDEENTFDSSYGWLAALLLMAAFADATGDLKFPPQPEYTKDDKALDEEYAKAGACERAIKDNRLTLQHGGHLMIRKDDGKIRCRGYIYGMNECVCDKCKACKLQYLHPYDAYWNSEEIFVPFDEGSERMARFVSDTLHFDCDDDIFSKLLGKPKDLPDLNLGIYSDPCKMRTHSTGNFVEDLLKRRKYGEN